MVLPVSSFEDPISPCTPLPPSRIDNDVNSSIESEINLNDSVMIDSYPEEVINPGELFNAAAKKRRDKTITLERTQSESGTEIVTQFLGPGKNANKAKANGKEKDKEKPGLNRRLSLSGIISPPIKLKALARRLPNSSSSPQSQTQTIRKNTTPASPIIPPSPSNPLILDSPIKSSTMPAVPPIITSTVLPSPQLVDGYPAIKRHWTGDMPASEEDEDSTRICTKEIVNKPKTALSRSNSSTTLTALDENAIYSPPSYTGPVPRRQPSPPTSSRRTPFLSRNSSFADDLTSLSEVDESLHNDHSFITSDMEPITPTSPETKSCSGIWLCSRPASSSRQSISEKACTTPRFTSRPVARSKNRPMVVRSMSTGRLASEFDSDGRVICLSAHSDRILKPTVSPSPTPPSSCKIRLTCESTPGLVRAKSYQVSRSTPVSPIEKPSSGTFLSAPQPKRTISEFGKQSSTERLLNSSSETSPTLTRTTSIGSWRKKAWSVGRSVRV